MGLEGGVKGGVWPVSVWTPAYAGVTVGLGSPRSVFLQDTMQHRQRETGLATEAISAITITLLTTHPRL